MWAAARAFPVFQVIPSSPWRILGVLFVVDGITAVTWATACLNKARTTAHYFEEPAVLVTGGPYRFTRNPVYLGMTTMLAGVALVLGSALVLPLPFVFAKIMDASYIPPEEESLERLFGEEYRRYRKSACRWIF
jgi:protein-S-isoprenylcysteine O-methyltransferase Ste14